MVFKAWWSFSLALLLVALAAGEEQPSETTSEPFTLGSLGGVVDAADAFQSVVVEGLVTELGKRMERTGMVELLEELGSTGLTAVLTKVSEAWDTVLANVDSLVTNTDVLSQVEAIGALVDEQADRLRGMCKNGSATVGKMQSARHKEEPQGRRARPQGCQTLFSCGGAPHAVVGAVEFGLELDYKGRLNMGYGLGLGVGGELGKAPSASLYAFGGIGAVPKKDSTPSPPAPEEPTPKNDWEVKPPSSLVPKNPLAFALDFMGDYSGSQALTVAISVSNPFGISNIHFYLGSDDWRCHQNFAKFIGSLRFVGFGFTLASGNRQDYKDKLKNLGSALASFGAAKQALLSGWGDDIGVSTGAGWTLAPAVVKPDCGDGAGRRGAVQSAGFDFSPLESLAPVLKAVMLDGEVVAPFCIGEGCGTEEGRDPKRSVGGSARIGMTAGCTGVELSVWTGSLTIGGVSYVALNPIGGGVAGSVVSLMGPLSGVGMLDATVSLSATKAGVGLTATGSPLIPAVGSDVGFVAALSEVASSAAGAVVLQASGTVQYSGALLLEFQVGMEPKMVTKGFGLMDTTGSLGISVFQRFQRSGGTTTGSLGAALPVKLCVERCSEPGKERYLYLNGEVALSVSPTSQMMRGKVVMDGWWTKALGLPFLHIGDVVLGIGVDLKVLVPTELLVGGAVCLGKETNCLAGTGPRVAGRAYVSVSATAPEGNWFVVMLGRLTVGDLFDVLGDFLGSAVRGVANGLPNVLRVSGLYPYDDGLPQCATTPVAGEGVASLNRDCYAFLSFSPSGEQRLSFTGGDVVVPQGVAFAGRLNFFGWEIKLSVAVSPTRFRAEGAMDNVWLKILGTSLMRIGERLEGKKAVGGARFLVDLQGTPSPSALVEVAGAFDIPVLKGYGALNVVLNGEVFNFSSTVSLFDGALSTSATVAWDWDMTYFTMQLEDITFLGGVVKANEVSFEYRMAERVELDVKLTVLCFAKIRTLLQFVDDEIRFLFKTKAAGASVTVGGDAKMDNSKLANSKFNVWSKVSVGETVEKLGKGVTAAAKETADAAKKVWDDTEEKATALWNDIKSTFNGVLKSIKNDVQDFLNNPNALLDGAAEVVSKIPVLNNAVKLADSLESGVKSFVNSLGKTFALFSTKVTTVSANGENKYGCPYVKDKEKTCWTIKILGKKTKKCDSTFSDKYPEPLCMARVAWAAKRVKERAEAYARKRNMVAGSKSRNPGYRMLLSGLNIPSPTVNPVSTTFADGKVLSNVLPCLVRPLSGTTGFLQPATSVTLKPSLDFTSEAALAATISKIGAELPGLLAPTVLRNQAGITSNLVAESKTAKLGDSLPNHIESELLDSL